MLKSIVENIVNRTLLTEITCKDAYQRFYKDIPLETYENIVVSAQGNNNILLPATKWVLSCFKRNPENTMRDIHTLRSEQGRGALDRFDRLVSRQMISGNDADLNRFKSIAELIDFVYEYDENDIFRRTSGEWSKAIKNAKNDIKKFYEDDTWFVVIPLSMDAACYWGSDTEWCTATRDEDENYFNRYNEQGPLIILINKKSGEKYQFHFETDSFMNKKDTRIQKPILKTIGATEGLTNAIEAYCEEIGYDFVDLIYEVIGGEYRGLTPVKIHDASYNLINEYNEIAFPQYDFSIPVKFDFEWAPVQGYESESKFWFQNFMNADGEMFFKQGHIIIEMGTPSYGLVYFKTRKGVNYFDLSEGKFLSDEWLVDGTDFKFSCSRTYSVAFIKNNEGKQNMIKAIDGELYSDEWYDGIKQLDCQSTSIFLVENTDENGNSIYNIIEFTDGIISDKWFYSVVDSGVDGIFFCRETPFNEESKILIVDVFNNRIIEDNITDIKYWHKFYGLGGLNTWFIKKNDKFNFLSIARDYRLPQWADEVKFIEPILTPEPNISTPFLKIKYRDMLMPLLRYGNEWYYPSCTDFREPVKLIKYDKEQTNENKLSKKDLMYIIKESTRLLTEISIKDAYSSYYKDIPEDIFTKIVSSAQKEPDVLLPITKWVLKCYKRNPQDTMSELNTLRTTGKVGVLDLYERLCFKDMIQQKDRNIDNFKTITELWDFVNRFDRDELLQMTPGEWSKTVNAAKNDVRKFYEDNNWFCIIPENKYAACYWGSGTRWCTAVRNENNYFDTYHKEGDLIVLINKQTKEKYQFHFESDQFMDKDDKQIETPVFQTINATEGLMESFKQYCSNIDDVEGYIELRYDIVNGDEERFCSKNQDGTYTYIDYEEDVIFPEYTFLTCYPFEYDYLPAKFIYNGNTYINILDENKETIFEYDDISEIVDVTSRTCIVKSDKYNGYNMVDMVTGEILFKTWLKNIDGFGGKNVVTYKNGKQNIVLWGNEILFDKPVDMVVTNKDTHYILVCKKIDGKNKWNVVGQASLILDEWYDSVTIKTYPENKEKSYVSFAENLFVVKNEGEGAKLLQQHHSGIETLIEGVDEIGSFVECDHNVKGVFVKKDGKTNFFDINIKKLLDNWYDKMEAGKGYFNIPTLFAYVGDKKYIVGRSPDEREFRTVPYRN